MWIVLLNGWLLLHLIALSPFFLSLPFCFLSTRINWLVVVYLSLVSLSSQYSLVSSLPSSFILSHWSFPFSLISSLYQSSHFSITASFLRTLFIVILSIPSILFPSFSLLIFHLFSISYSVHSFLHFRCPQTILLSNSSTLPMMRVCLILLLLIFVIPPS